MTCLASARSFVCDGTMSGVDRCTCSGRRSCSRVVSARYRTREEYGEQLRTSVDLYRRLLVKNWADGPRRHSSDRDFFDAAVAFMRDGLKITADDPDDSIPDPRLQPAGVSTRPASNRRRHVAPICTIARATASVLTRPIGWVCGRRLLLVAAGTQRRRSTDREPPPCPR